MAFKGPIEDRLAIRDLYGLYADASSRGSREDFLACWADDCLWTTHLFSRSGKAELGQQWDALWENFASLGFLSEIGAIEVDGDRATARCLASETIRLTSGGVYRLIGRYEDRLVRRNGAWLFSRRDYQPVVDEPPA
jgi:ketosteroid isomerase-like protein